MLKCLAVAIRGRFVKKSDNFARSDISRVGKSCV